MDPRAAAIPAAPAASSSPAVTGVVCAYVLRYGRQLVMTYTAAGDIVVSNGDAGDPAAGWPAEAPVVHGIGPSEALALADFERRVELALAARRQAPAVPPAAEPVVPPRLPRRGSARAR